MQAVHARCESWAAPVTAVARPSEPHTRPRATPLFRKPSPITNAALKCNQNCLSQPKKIRGAAALTRASGEGNGASVDDSVLRVFEQEDIKLECDESGCVIVSAGAKSSSLEEQQDEGTYLNCNLTGCFYTRDPPTSDFRVLEGTGWRLGYETAPENEDTFAAMVGAGGWSIALTASEFHDFCRLIQMLRNGIITMDQDGILGRDDIVMQVEKGSMWMECVVPKKVLPTLQRFLKFGGGSNNTTSAFEIRFILTGKTDKRQAEGYWPAEAVMDMLKKIDSLSGARTPAAAAGAQALTPAA